MLVKNQILVSIFNGWWQRTKEAKGTKKCVIKCKLKFEDCKFCLQASEIENKIAVLEDHNCNVEEVKQDHEKFLKKYEIIRKSQQGFQSNGPDRSTVKWIEWFWVVRMIKELKHLIA